MKKEWFKIANLLNGLFFIGVVVLLINPSAKALAIQGLMKVGLFQPAMPHPQSKSINNPPLPDVVFKGANGSTLHLAQLKGKVVFINFWATWCPPCIAEMPSINNLYEKLKGNKNVVFIMVDADSNFQKSVPFMAKRHFAMPLYQLASGVPETLVGNSIPATTIIDKSGAIVFHQAGSADYSNPKILAYIKGIAK